MQRMETGTDSITGACEIAIPSASMVPAAGVCEPRWTSNTGLESGLPPLNKEHVCLERIRELVYGERIGIEVNRIAKIAG